MEIKSKTSSLIKAIFNLIYAPFFSKLCFIISYFILYFCIKVIIYPGLAPFYSYFAEVYIIVLGIYLLRIPKCIETIILILYGFLLTVDIYLLCEFNLSLSPQVFQLISETNISEANGFVREYIERPYAIKSIIVYTTFLTISLTLYSTDNIIKRYIIKKTHKLFNSKKLSYSYRLFTLSLVIFSFVKCDFIFALGNHLDLLKCKSLSKVEDTKNVQDEKQASCLIGPLAGLTLSARIYYLISQQCNNLYNTSKSAKITSCNHTSPNIIFFIGESYIKSHSQIYGYALNTCPNLANQINKGNLFVFDDVITPIPMTSDVFKYMMSMQSYDLQGDYSDKPLFLQLLHLGGYRVSFLSQQFLIENEDIWSLSGGYFLNDPKITKLSIDYRNTKSFDFDDKLLPELYKQMEYRSNYKFSVFHVKGQHFPVGEQFPKSQTHFTSKDYGFRKDLKDYEKQAVADYDNATLYQDSIFGDIFKTFNDKDVIVVFVSDHGENVFDANHRVGRLHDNLSPEILKCQNQVPMWIWCSPVYQKNHPEIVSRIKESLKKPFEIDDISHMFLYLSGTNCKYYDPTRNILSPQFNKARKRLVGRNKVDYDDIIKQSH